MTDRDDAGGQDLEDPSAWFCTVCEKRFPKAGTQTGEALRAAREHVVTQHDDEDAEPRFDPGPRDEEIATDGGVVEYECMNCGRVNNCRVDGDGVRRCTACGRAVRAMVTDGGQVIPPEVDAEELRRRQKTVNSTTPLEERKRCPECGYLDIVNIVGRREADYDYRCNNGDCQARLDEGDLVTGEAGGSR